MKDESDIIVKPSSYNARVWTMRQSTESKFPEEELPGWPYDDTTNTGICFSGGGSRALSAAMGQMRGLRALGLLSKARYISCVSGGSWASTAYTFLPSFISDDDFLGQNLEPDQIRWSELGGFPPECLGNSATHSLWDALAYMKKIAVPKDARWLRTVGYLFLKPFGKTAANSNGLNNLDWLFTWDDETRQEILSNNPGMAVNFYTVENENRADRRPYLIVNGTWIWPPSFLGHENLIPIEFTPLYTGIPNTYQISDGKETRTIGGGYVESFAFNSALLPQNSGQQDRVVVSVPEEPFNLSDMAGTSSAFFAAAADDVDAQEWIPQFKYWSIADTSDQDVPTYTYTFGDGGVLDNTGILALLARRVQNIIVFVNCETPIWKEWRFNHIRVDDMLPPLFGFEPFSDFHPYRQYPPDSRSPMKNLKIFNPEDFTTLVTNLYEAFQQGKTVMYQQEYEIVTPNFFGIDYGDVKVNILWVYNNRVDGWQKQIPDPLIQEYLSEGQGDFPHGPLKNFPNYSTAFDEVVIWNPLTWSLFGDLDQPQVNMLANLSHWNIATDDIGITGKPNNEVFRMMFPDNAESS
jgi:hypothetical protein